VKNYKIFLLLILASSFFGFIDDKIHGWSDTHQYQVEAREWKKGARPPSNDLLLDPLSPYFVGPTHVPPLTPYLLSYLVDLKNPTKTSLYISILQALILFSCFILFVLLVGSNKISFSGLAFGVILFFHPLVRWWVFMPMSEPLSLLILLLSYYFKFGFAGIGAALQAVTRPPVAVLQLPLLFRGKNQKKLILGFFITALICILFFRNLVIPSKFHGMGFDIAKSVETFKGFIADSALIFKRLFPIEKIWFLILWGSFLITVSIFTVFRRFKNWSVWLCSLAYLAVISSASGEGFRYLFPMIIFLFVEFKPTLPSSRIIRGLVTILVIHMVIQQIQGISDLRGEAFPESDSVGLRKARDWLNEHSKSDDILMMYRYRLCVNYFNRPCLPIPSDINDLERIIESKRVRFIVVNEIYWQIEELTFEKSVELDLKKKTLPLVETHQFENVRVIDLRKVKD
jgi:hypothetical protein